MTVTLHDIEQAFNELESGAKTREQIANYATKAMQAEDNSCLEMRPSSESGRIWKAITYLSGVDLQEEPNVYLHCVEDFIEYRRQIGIS